MELVELNKHNENFFELKIAESKKFELSGLKCPLCIKQLFEKLDYKIKDDFKGFSYSKVVCCCGFVGDKAVENASEDGE